MILDADWARPTHHVGVVSNRDCSPDGVPGEELSRARRIGIALELLRCVVDLIEEAKILSVARRRIGTRIASRFLKPPRGRPGMSDEALLFLEKDNQDLLRDSTGPRNPVNDFCSCLAALRNKSFTQCSLRFVCRARRIILQTDIARGAGLHFRIKKTLYFLLIHRIAVEKILVGNNVPGAKRIASGEREELPIRPSATEVQPEIRCGDKKLSIPDDAGDLVFLSGKRGPSPATRS